MKNFLSVGNVTQAVHLDEFGLSLILGENLDQGGGGSRNGVGKTTIIQAISYALYGESLTSIKKDNLINKVNNKQMLVSLDFEIDGKKYRIERGRKPNVVRYFVNDGLVNAPDTDESHGESKWTQMEIERVFGMSPKLFKHIVALHTKITPFLSLRDREQREIIEELLGITQLSAKAEKLKELLKQTRDEIRSEEIRIKTITDSNDKIQKTINDLQFKDQIWEREHNKKLEKIQKAIDQLKEIDIELEIENHRKFALWSKVTSDIAILEKEVNRIDRSLSSLDSSIKSTEKQLQSAEEHSCPTCGQEVHDEKHKQIIDELSSRLSDLLKEKRSFEEDLFELAPALELKISELQELGSCPSIHYDSIEQALNHRHTLDKLESDLQRELKLESPFIEQIANLSTSGLQDINYNYLNELTRLKDHQEFLQKLLTSKDSFIRKKIIDQNITYLNHRLNHYLVRLNLPHEVIFQSDLSVQITQLGKDYDFEQLSNGEATRLVLALAWSFRDVWESLNHQLNLLMIDELVDSGMDSQGMDSSLDVLKQLVRERNKNVFLISHRDDLRSRVPNILLVKKENGFSTFESDAETA